MPIHLTEKQALALKKEGMSLPRALGVRSISEYEPHAIDWSDLNKHSAEVVRSARAKLDAMGDSVSEERMQVLDDAHGALMEIYDAIEREKDIRSEVGNKGPRQSSYHPNTPNPGDATVNGSSGERSADPEAAFALRSKQTYVDWIRERGGENEYSTLSTGAYLRAMVLGPKTELERRALAEGTDSAGGYTVPEILSARLIDRLRSASVVMRAGSQTVPLSSDVNYVAKVASDPTPGWRNEAAQIAESDPTFDRVTLTARSLAVLVKVSRELLEDTLNIGTALPDLLSTALAQELDRVALLGSGTAPEPKGVVNFAGLTGNGFAGGALTGYGPLITARTALRTVDSDVTAYIMSPRDDGTLAGLTDSQGQPLNVPPAIANTPMLVTSKMPTNGGDDSNASQIIAGDWRNLMIGIRSEVRIEILRELFAGTHQYGFVAHLRADIAAEHEAAFTVLDGITPAA